MNSDGRWRNLTTDKVWDKIQELMDAKGWSLYKLAKLSGLNYQTIYSAKSRRSRLSSETIKAVSNAFGMSELDFMSLIEPSGPEIWLTAYERELIEQQRKLPESAKPKVLKFIHYLLSVQDMS